MQQQQPYHVILMQRSKGCKTTHELIYSTACPGSTLNPSCNTLNLLFKIPKVCSTLVLQKALLKLFCGYVAGLKYGVIRWRLHGYPESPSNKPLWIPVKQC